MIDRCRWASGICELQVRRLHPFVKDNNPDAVCLETVAVSRAMVEQLNAVADEAVVRRSWFEVSPAKARAACLNGGFVLEVNTSDL